MLGKTRSILARSVISPAGRFHEDNDHEGDHSRAGRLQHDSAESGSSARASVMCIELADFTGKQIRLVAKRRFQL
jgi:hypothetical protein